MRYSIPRIRRTLVPRTRQTQALQDWRALRVIAVVAPAGFGKTTLVSEWLHALPAADRPLVAWWNLDVSDNAPDVFLRRMLTALRSSVDDAAGIDELIAAAAGQVPPQRIVQMLAALLDLPTPLLFVLDDVHLLADPDVQQLIQTLIDEAPAALHFAFLSRTTLPFTLIRQRLSGALLELGPRDLAFDHHEFEEFVRSSALSHCPPQVLADIERRSEGWIAGLQMFALTSERDAPLLAAETFVPEFLQHEVIRRLPADLVDILVRSSMLPWLNAASLTAVLDIPRPAADAVLQQILRTGLLAQTFAPAPQSADVAVRLHPLLREHLLAQLHRTVAPDELKRLRQRAADAIAADGDVDAALALLTDDDHAAARLLAGYSRDALRRGEYITLQRWMRSISEAARRTQPQLAIDAAWLSYMADSGNQREHITTARHAIAGAADAPGEIHDEWMAELNVLEGLHAVFEHRYDDAVAAYRRATDAPHRSDGLANAYRLELSVHLSQITSLDDQDHVMRRSGEIFRRIGFMVQSVESILVRSLMLWQRPDVLGALLAVQEAAAVIKVERLELSSISAYLYHIRGEILYYVDRIPEARESLQRSLQVSRSIGESQSMDYWSHLLLQLCDRAESIDSSIDDEMDENLWIDSRRRFMLNVYARSAWLRIRRDAAFGRRNHIHATLRALDVQLVQLNSETNETMWFAVLNGGIYVADDPAALEAPLLRLVDLMHERKRHWSAVHARTLIALLYARIGRIADARAQIAQLLPILERNRCSRFLLEYPELIPLIAMEHSLFAQSMLQRAPAAEAPALHPFGLSDREIDILRLLVAGRDTAEISRTLHIAITTLRTHINSIYHKLGVHSRAEAVRVARAVGLGEGRGER